MSKSYVYPAIFHPEEDGGYSIFFPDIPECMTQGDDLADACFMAQDALNFVLLDYESDTGKPIPTASAICDVKTDAPSDFVSLVTADPVEYRKRTERKAVKKTLTIPQWLDTAAQRANINFSNVLQNALIKELGL